MLMFLRLASLGLHFALVRLTPGTCPHLCYTHWSTIVTPTNNTRLRLSYSLSDRLSECRSAFSGLEFRHLLHRLWHFGTNDQAPGICQGQGIAGLLVCLSVCPF